jgi:hypothetical protein
MLRPRKSVQNLDIQSLSENESFLEVLGFHDVISQKGSNLQPELCLVQMSVSCNGMLLIPEFMKVMGTNSRTGRRSTERNNHYVFIVL